MSDGCNLAFVKRNNEPSHELNSYVCVLGYRFCLGFCDFSIKFCNCSDIVVFFVFHLINLYSKLHRRQITRGVAQWVRSLDLTTHTSLSPIRRGFAPGFVNYEKECTRLAAANDKVYQLLAHGREFSPGTPASSTTKTGRHDIAEILLKVALKHQK
jgi:hypothetical protein